MQTAAFSVIDDLYPKWDKKLEGWCKSHRLLATFRPSQRYAIDKISGQLDQTLVHEVNTV